MSSAVPSIRRPADGAGSAPVRSANAFGLRVESRLPLAGFVPAPGDPRSTIVRSVTHPELRSLWPSSSSELLRACRFADGTRWLTVEHVSGVGYRVWGSGHGTHLVLENGRAIVSALPSRGTWHWQRLLFAQVLPLAAQVQGFDLLHASAVRMDGSIVALVAPSGMGKSTLAAHLVAGGETFVTDDVLAVSSADGTVIAHPGAALIGLDQHEYRRLFATGCGHGARLGGAAKVYLEFETAKTPGPLAAICFLDRRDVHMDVALDEQIPPEPTSLLAASFFAYLRAGDHLARHLATCADIAAATRVFTLRVPARLSPADAAARVAEALRTELGKR